MKEIVILEYLKKFDIDINRIINRYVQILKMMHKFIDVHGFGDNVIVNGRLLKKVVTDYFVDCVRVKEFHTIQTTNREKIYAYTAYWLLKRKPLQVISPFEGCEFVNELFIANFIVSSVSAARGIGDDKKAKNPTFEKFQALLFYNLKYRPVSQQSLELMIEAFFGGYDFTT